MIESDAQKAIRTFNIELLIVALLIFVVGIVTLNSATSGPGYQFLVKKQLISFGLAVIISLPFLFMDSQVFERFAYPFYAACIGLLTLVLFLGRIGGGAKSWFDFGFFDFQPSELTKIALVFGLAKYFSQDRKPGPYTLSRLILPALIIAPSLILIVVQPDIGTAGILFLAAASIILFLRMDWRSLFIVVMIGLVTVPVIYTFGLKDYQKRRVLAFLDPGSDPRGSGYNALQSKIAIGSGQVMGKGYLEGSQSQLNFIPEQHTDFIFSVLAEEWGFLGGMLVLLLYYFYCLFSLQTVANARDKFQMLLALGLTAIFFWHVVINIGMVVGMLPIVGVTLPLFSYGGTSLLMFILQTALLLNLSRKRYIF